MSFVAGAVYGLNCRRIEAIVRKNYLLCFAIAFVLFASVDYAPFIGRRGWVLHNIKSIAFAAIVVIATMKISVNSIILRWSGEHLFPIYVYQRIPMIVMFAFDPIKNENWRLPVYLAFSLVITAGIAVLYPGIRISLWSHEKA